MVTRSWSFLKIIGNILITRSINFTLSGGPTFVDGPTGGFALLLNKLNQFIDLGDQTGSCVGDLEKCSFGLSFRFNLKVFSFTENMYIISNGGNEPGKYGISMWYAKKRLYLTISTKTRSWTVYSPFKVTGKFVKIEFSWSIQRGLKLFFDGRVVAQTTTFYTRTVTAVISSFFYIGKSVLNANIFGNFAIEGWEVAECPLEVLGDFNINLGE